MCVCVVARCVPHRPALFFHVDCFVRYHIRTCSKKRRRQKAQVRRSRFPVSGQTRTIHTADPLRVAVVRFQSGATGYLLIPFVRFLEHPQRFEKRVLSEVKSDVWHEDNASASQAVSGTPSATEVGNYFGPIEQCCRPFYLSVTEAKRTARGANFLRVGAHHLHLYGVQKATSLGTTKTFREKRTRGSQQASVVFVI